jgi:glycosyltransferase involved in cell wall biosynthesis
VPTVLSPAAHDEPAIRLPIFREMFARAGGITFYTAAERRFVHGLFPVGSVPQATIGLGVSTPAEGFRSGAPARARPYLLCLGRVDDGKGTDALARCFAAYKRRRPGPLELVFAGPVVDPPTSSPDTVVLGPVDEETKWSLVADALALVSPSPNESFGIVLLESWQVRTPVVVNSACAPTREQVEQSGGGLVFGSYAELEVCIDELTERPALREGLGDRGYRYVQRRYDWSSVVARYAAFFEQVARRRP